MAKRPVIGVSGSHNVTDRQFFVRENYMESVLRAGGIPVLLPEIDNAETAAHMLDSLDGLLLAGGGDVAPVRYGEAQLPVCGEVDDKRDTFELLMIPMALERRMPVFGICRGIQVLAAALGGTLIQDIETQLSIPMARHQQQPPYGEATHSVHFAPDSVFARVTGTADMRVNSMHHQAIKSAGPRLRVEGLSEDGVIEAVSGVDNDRLFAVQFHPEYLADHDACAQKLFDHFVALARDYQSEKA